ncbi:MAG: XRE family transcriptional regulator [Clostridia bacterium]|nr:XRE family transcriptional regulator [Clostridia bacterium]
MLDRDAADKIYHIKLEDETVLSFACQNKLLKEPLQILFVHADTSLLPPGLKPTSDGVMNWLHRRAIPRNREYAEDLLEKTGLAWEDIMGFIEAGYGLSLNDSYWVVEDGFKGSFARQSLYDSPFAQDVAILALTGHGHIKPHSHYSTPELTTDGMLPKCWRRIDGKIFLYKGGTMGAANAGQEPYSEYYAAQTAEAMGIKHISYDLRKWKGTLASVCELFTSKDVSYVPMWKVVKGTQLIDVVNYLKDLGDEFYNEFADMMVFDALIYNSDRHYSNFGLLADSHTNKPVAYAPVFDNGLSLFNFAYGDDFKDLEAYAKTRPCTLGMSFDDNARLFMSGRQKAMLRNLICFTFKKHPRYNWPQGRLKAVEQFIQRRVRFLLDM